MTTLRKQTSTNFHNLQQIKVTCPMQYAMQKLGGRWKLIILWYVHRGINRFSSLKSRIEDITPKMLAQQIRQLEADGLLIRSIVSERPIHVEYALTESGKKLLPVLNALNTWALADVGVESEDQFVC